jgi:hypothetical protein
MEKTLNKQFLGSHHSEITSRLIREHKKLRKLHLTPLTDIEILSYLQNCLHVLRSAERIFGQDYTREKKDIMLIMLQINLFQYSNNKTKEAGVGDDYKEWQFMYIKYAEKAAGKILLT